MIGLPLGTDMRRHWSADAAFFDQLRDREVLLAIVGEVAGADAAAGNKDAKGKALKAIIANCLAGENGRAKAEPWLPLWMAFPPSAYTARGGVGRVAADARVGAELAASVDAEGQGGGEATLAACSMGRAATGRPPTPTLLCYFFCPPP